MPAFPGSRRNGPRRVERRNPPTGRPVALAARGCGAESTRQPVVLAGREPQQPVAQLLLPPPPPGTGLPGLAPVLPQPPPLPAERAARAGGQESGGTTQRQPPSPLAGDAGLRTVLPQLTSRRQPSPSAIPSAQRSGSAPVTQKRAELNRARNFTDAEAEVSVEQRVTPMAGRRACHLALRRRAS